MRLFQIILVKGDKVWADGDRDFWMKSDEAKDYGMIDEVYRRINNEFEQKCFMFFL